MQSAPALTHVFGGAPLARIAGFGPGVRLMTPEGELPVEWLATGDVLVTAEGVPAPVLWIGRQRFAPARLARSPELRPVDIAAGALGAGYPTQSMQLAPATRLLLSGWEVELFAGVAEALATVSKVVDGHRIGVPTAALGTQYTYVLLPAHALVQANGLWVETLLLDRAALRHFGDEIPHGVLASPEVLSGHASTARPCLAGWEVAAVCGETGDGIAGGLVRHVA